MSILSISVLAFVFVASIWALVPGLVIKFVHSAHFNKLVKFVMLVAYGMLGTEAFAHLGDGHFIGFLVNAVVGYLVFCVQEKYFSK
jgi:hypothetical protein